MRDLPSYARAWEPCAVSVGREPAQDLRTMGILPALCLHPWAVPVPSVQPPHQTRALGMSWQLPLPLSFSMTHPLQGKIKTSAHIR